MCVLHVYTPRGLNYVCPSHTDIQNASTTTLHAKLSMLEAIDTQPRPLIQRLCYSAMYVTAIYVFSVAVSMR